MKEKGKCAKVLGLAQWERKHRKIINGCAEQKKNEKENNSAIILGKGTAEVQCNGRWLCPLQKYHMNLQGRYKSHLIGIEPSLSLKLWIRDMFKTDVLQNKA